MLPNFYATYACIHSQDYLLMKFPSAYLDPLLQKHLCVQVTYIFKHCLDYSLLSRGLGILAVFMQRLEEFGIKNFLKSLCWRAHLGNTALLNASIATVVSSPLYTTEFQWLCYSWKIREDLVILNKAPHTLATRLIAPR